MSGCGITYPEDPQCAGPAQAARLVHRGLRGSQPACPHGQLAQHRRLHARRTGGGGARHGRLWTTERARPQALVRAG
eukprot:15259053-Alexandrium_andersonii.AAC.1